MDGTFRRELARSVRLFVDEELWLFAGLAGGGAGYLVWLAGTGVAVARAARGVLGPVSLSPWSSDAAILAATFAFLWVVVPAAVAVWYVVDGLTNIRGNIERCYRVEEPVTLLVPPFALLAVTAVIAAATGTLSPAVLVVLGVANSLLLVRAVAYGYRVYSLSIPRLLHFLVFVGAATVCLAVVSRTGSMTDQSALVEAAAAQYGVAEFAFGTTTWAGVTVDTLPFVGAVAPGVIALGYVWVQVFASLIVRIRRPEVPRSAVRPGQRYPAVVQPGTNRRLAMGTGGNGGGNPTGNDGAGGSASGAAGGSGGGNSTATDGASSDAGDGADAVGATGDSTDDDRIGNTRVYTPPEDAEVEEDEGVGKSELCPICGATFPAAEDHTHCPNCNAIIDEG